MHESSEKREAIDRDPSSGEPAETCVRTVVFVGDVAKEASSQIPTSVEVFKQAGRWYCRVCRGDEKTRPMGPYTKRQAERLQDARRLLLARKGTARVLFDKPISQRTRSPSHVAVGRTSSITVAAVLRSILKRVISAWHSSS